MSRLRIKRKAPKRRFKNPEEMNEFYMRHCWTCRRPLPDDMVSELEEIHRQSPEMRFMMDCPNCQKKNR
jgi:hypothetical protein